ncbi:AraC-type DNA-binding protein [Andreprevotia lacus DSM 23236]|jgi:AraC-like DNA-binding protein|uniref:AraC-type DNA-binding protein n=1 Tax=Andreprevotia lacus DSM 23236 TaxID=1121001 RepID=A0A1W1X5V0_9NEIS|nr:AraC family transcriptional regulator [Andreprevotia lacus]SMC19173.1 AraC-type DNA-binding protein [Andreprevotia lacus DSM 23236]
MDRNALPPLAVIGRSIYPDLVMPIAVAEGEVLAPADPAHPRYVIVHVRQGSALLSLHGQPVLVSAPAVLLLDESSRPAIIRATRLALSCVYFHPCVVNSVFSIEALQSTPWFDGTASQDAWLLQPFLDAIHMGQPLTLLPALHAQLAAACARIAAEGDEQRDGNWPCRMRSWLIELLFRLRVLSDDAPAHASTAATGHRLDQVLLLVHDRYNTSFTLDELARWCGSNRTTLNQHFRKLTGQSVRAYTIALRMQMAATLLRDTLLPVSEVMERVGYDNPSNFTRTFRQTTGVTPRQYRTAECWMQ